ncbi:hypothetical protein B7P43_G06211 [Cryptotermes secundus]|uniref:C2H2-type domain-containing protein n=1 Tax=Cryptotermes secundus TaxID=105785 RepID=A0A2J7QN46_9NEOP|nr:hypothetical protein B7P43_G06211 [Cryptotermes secundus]
MHAREAVVAHRSEVKPHQCQQCLKSFSSNHQLVQHIRVHTGEKPYKCSYCDRRFKQLSHVQQHTRLHTAEKVGMLCADNSPVTELPALDIMVEQRKYSFNSSVTLRRKVYNHSMQTCEYMML